MLPESFLKDLDVLLATHGKAAAKGLPRAVSPKTTNNRRNVLVTTFTSLRMKGWKLGSPSDLSSKAVKDIALHWIKQGEQLPTVRSKLSILRAFGRWIGKPALVATETDYFRDAGLQVNTKRRHVAPISSDTAIDAIAQVTSRDQFSGLILEIVYRFGINPADAIQIRPLKDVRDNLLHLSRTTRGAFMRAIPIETPAQRDVLDRAKAVAAAQRGHLYPAGTTAARAQGKFTRTLLHAGFGKKNGITATNFKMAYLAERRAGEETETVILRRRLVKQIERMPLDQLGEAERKLRELSAQGSST